MFSNDKISKEKKNAVGKSAGWDGSGGSKGKNWGNGVRNAMLLV